jgi:hypothetical protein
VFIISNIVLLYSGLASANPIETIISQRFSLRVFTDDNVSPQKLLNVLRFSYGYSDNTRVLQKIGNQYSLVIFAVNSSGSYRYLPETNTLSLDNPNVNNEVIRPYDSGWPSNADVVLIIVWNQTVMNNPYFASAEAGCFAQNVYLASIDQNLGTTVVGLIDSNELRNTLALSTTMTPLLVMPVGYPTEPYSTATPDYSRMMGNLPSVQISETKFADALNGITYAEEWSDQNLSQQELSKLLWAAYGYSSTSHRTTPSAYGIYPLVVYALNATGTFRYYPEIHSLEQVQIGDKRLNIATTLDSRLSFADAPTIFLIAYDQDYNGGNTGDQDSTVTHEFIEVDAGCVIQQIILEASAWNISANVVTEGLAEWQGIKAQTLQQTLGLTNSIIPLYVVPVGHVNNAPMPTSSPSPSSAPSPSQSPIPSPTSSEPINPSSTPLETPASPSQSPIPSPTSSEPIDPSSTPLETPDSNQPSTPKPTSVSVPIEYIVAIIAAVGILTFAAVALGFRKWRKPDFSTKKDVDCKELAISIFDLDNCA